MEASLKIQNFQEEGKPTAYLWKESYLYLV